MKKLLITAMASLLCGGAFGQGCLIFSVNYDNLIYFTTDTAFLNPLDVGKTFDVAGPNAPGGPYPLAGSLAATGPGINGGTGSIQVLLDSSSFVAALYAGTSSSYLSLQTTTSIDTWENNNPGGIVSVNANMAAPIHAGTPAWFQVQVFDSRVDASHPVVNGVGGGAEWAWIFLRWYAGASPIFQATPGLVPDYIYNRFAPVNSTWAPGTFDPVDLTIVLGGPGSAYGGIALCAMNILPESPYFLRQPKSTTNYWRQNATFSAVASGAYPMPTYQWQVNGTNLYNGPRVSSSATYDGYYDEWHYQLTLNAITLADAGSYRLFLSNYWGTALSDPTTLTVVLIPPAISNVVPQPDGSMTLNLTGTPYSTNRLWATADLTPPVVWSPVSTNVASPAGTWQVTDPGVAGWTNRFYRTSMP
jgi:hypothetical protein